MNSLSASFIKKEMKNSFDSFNADKLITTVSRFTYSLFFMASCIENH